MKYSQENLTSELSKLMAEKAEGQQRIEELEEDIKVLNDREKEGNMELERQAFETYPSLDICLGVFISLGLKQTFFLSHRLKERVKKTSSQMKHDEEKRKSLQVIAFSSSSQTAWSEDRQHCKVL